MRRSYRGCSNRPIRREMRTDHLVADGARPFGPRPRRRISWSPWRPMSTTVVADLDRRRHRSRPSAGPSSPRRGCGDADRRAAPHHRLVQPARHAVGVPDRHASPRWVGDVEDGAPPVRDPVTGGDPGFTRETRACSESAGRRSAHAIGDARRQARCRRSRSDPHPDVGLAVGQRAPGPQRSSQRAPRRDGARRRRRPEAVVESAELHLVGRVRRFVGHREVGEDPGSPHCTATRCDRLEQRHEGVGLARPCGSSRCRP